MEQFLHSNYSRGVVNIVGIFLITIFAGEFNLLGFLYPYYLSYFRKFDNDLNMSDLIWIPIIWISAAAIASPINIRFAAHIGNRNILFFYVFLSSITHFMCQYINNFLLFSIIYAIVGGVCQSCMLIIPMIHVWRFFPADKKSIVNGIMFTCFAASPFITSFIVFYTINPNNLRQHSEFLRDGAAILVFGKEVSDNVPKYFRLYSILTLIFGSIGAFINTEPIMMEDDSEQIKNDAFQEEIHEVETLSLTLLVQKYLKDFIEIIHDKIYLMFSLLFFLNAGFNVIVSFSFKSIGLEYLKDDAYVTMVGGFGAVANCCFRLSGGYLFEKYGFKRFVLFLVILQLITSWFFMDASHYKSLYALMILMYEFSYSCHSVLPIALYYFYKEKTAHYYAYVYFVMRIGVLVFLLTYSFFLHHFSLAALFKMIFILTVIAFYPYSFLCEKYSDLDYKNDNILLNK